MSYNRISGRVGNVVNLNVQFYRHGVPTDPWAIRMVRIYRRSVEEANLVAEIPFPYPDTSEYPAPSLYDPAKPGYYVLPFQIPDDFTAPDIYYDVWHFICDEFADTDFDLDDESYWQAQCNKFWVYPDGCCYTDDGLMVPRLGFEPLDVQFRAGETRYLEVGLMPIPLYDYDYNLITPMLPCIDATITISTGHCETIVDEEPMEIGLRQGSYRTNPFVVKYLVDTSKFLIGTYEYQVKLNMPNGQTIVSPKYTFTIS